MKLCIKHRVETVLESQSLDAPDAEVIMKRTDAGKCRRWHFFPALEQNMMGAVLINEMMK